MDIKSSIVEVHVFRIKDSKMEFLILQRTRNQNYGGLWQMVTGKIENNEKAYQTALREVAEETKLSVKNLWVVPNVNSFYSQEDDVIYKIPVFAAEVNCEPDVKLSKEHCKYVWAEKKEAMALFAWEGQKKSLKIFTDYYFNKKEYLELLKITF